LAVDFSQTGAVLLYMFFLFSQFALAALLPCFNIVFFHLHYSLTEFLTAPPPVFARQVRFERDIWGLFTSIEKPFIAAMHGYVLGSGIEMSLCCDIRLCSDNARFGLPEVTLAIMPAAGGSQTLPRAVGRSNALDVLLTGRWLNADEARRLKLVNKVLPGQDLLAEAERLAYRIKDYDPKAVTCAKQAITRGLEMTLEEGLSLEKRLGHSLINLSF